MLTDELLRILSTARPGFRQARTHQRATRQAIGSLMAMGERTVTQILRGLGRDQQDWTAEYRLHALARWDPTVVFRSILETALGYCSDEYVPIALDDTATRKTGRTIAHVSWQRDPMSPPFRANLMLGLRYLQASVLLPLYRHEDSMPPWAIPIAFEEVAPVRRPKKKAGEEDWKTYREAKRRWNLSIAFVEMVRSCRQQLDALGASNRRLIVSTDGSYCNQTTFRAQLERTDIIARSRKDAMLCHPAAPSSGRIYESRKFTPEEVRGDDAIPLRSADIFYGGRQRSVSYKEISPVLWQRGSKRRPLRLLVIAPLCYRVTAKGKYMYRKPAYLLTTDLQTPAPSLLQVYFDRWQIEVNFRDEKTTLGVGQARVRLQSSVRLQPALVVAAYSALMLAGLTSFGPRRTQDYRPLPKWRRNAIRPSCLDLVALLRQEIIENPHLISHLGAKTDAKLLTQAAAA